MNRRRPLPGERIELYSPIGLVPVDTLTGKSPLGRYRVILDIQDESGEWRETDIKETRTAGGVIAYPGLGRTLDVTTQQPRVYRVRIEAELYVPYYGKDDGTDASDDGIKFTALPYSDTVPPANYPTDPSGFADYLKDVLRKVFLMPAPNYPFPAQLIVLRGVVRNSAKEPIIGANVSWRAMERTITGGREVKLPGTVASRHPAGEFSLPIRPTKPVHLSQKQKIDALDPKTGNKTVEEVNILQAAKSNLIITIPTP